MMDLEHSKTTVVIIQRYKEIIFTRRFYTLVACICSN